ncbi:MAG: S-methyl-5-thioribose-1-phosphate isomerase [Clostridia bacterium]|nr:S-methyl-5-thioribose-1-phosphate isomerase [Clostridia bacterium]
MNNRSLMDIDTVALCDEDSAIVIIDQTKLPGTIETVSLHTQKEIWDAIYRLMVRGAPAIGDTAAMAYYLAAKGHIKDDPAVSPDALTEMLPEDKAYMASSRPTAVNLFWALDRMERVYLANREKTNEEILAILRAECEEIKDEDIRVCHAIGEYGLSLVKPGDGILTHCNAGQLATAKYGTATAPIYLGQERGYHFRVFADETRPLLQGARLTAAELHASGVDVTVICDNMSSSVMQRGWVDAVFVGCDRVAANGDTANKIGTSVVACVARQYGVPVYICAPTSTIDMNCPTGADIPIEERRPEEVTELWYKERMAPEGIKVYNPAFDVTDHTLIAGIVTEYGIARPPYDKSFAEIFAKKEEHPL